MMIASKDVRHSTNCPFVKALYAFLSCSSSEETLRARAGRVLTLLPVRVECGEVSYCLFVCVCMCV